MTMTDLSFQPALPLGSLLDLLPGSLLYCCVAVPAHRWEDCNV